MSDWGNDETFVVEHEPDLSIPEDTIVRAVVAQIKKEVVPYVDKKTGEDKEFAKLVWWFEVTAPEYTAPDGTRRRIKGETDVRITDHPRNRFRQWAETLLGRELAFGVGVSLSDLTGLPCDITIAKEPDRKDPKKFWDRVDEVLPVVSTSGAGGWGAEEPPF